MKKLYFIDLLFIGLSAILAFLLAQKPGTVSGVKPSLPAKAENAGEMADKGPVSALFSRGDVSHMGLNDRNIFSADGRYAQISAQGKKEVPETAYTLLGVIHGKEKKAVFREYTGAVVSFGRGAGMIDGSVITDIGSLSVKVKKGKAEKEYRILDVRKKDK